MPKSILSNLRRGLHRPLLFTLLITGISFYHASLQAETYLSPKVFISQAFANKPPSPKVLWINKDIRKQGEQILAHKVGFFRTRYWKHGAKSVWILDEIGKTKPITVGITINRQQIETIKVLVFKESRGWEVKHDFFTKQFTNAQLEANLQLNQNVDGISGATLSVRAVTKLARLALLFDRIIQ